MNFIFFSGNREIRKQKNYEYMTSMRQQHTFVPSQTFDGFSSGGGAPVGRGGPSRGGRGFGSSRGGGRGRGFGRGAAFGRGKKQPEQAAAPLSWTETPAATSGTNPVVTNVSVVDGRISVPKHPCMKLNERFKGVPYKVTLTEYMYNIVQWCVTIVCFLTILFHFFTDHRSDGNLPTNHVHDLSRG